MTPEQLTLAAHARRGDPPTSRAAAASVGDLRPRQRAVYDVLAEIGPATHERLIAVYRLLAAHRGHVELPPQTDQSVRSRCAELVDAGFVGVHDREGVTVNGRAATRWVALA